MRLVYLIGEPGAGKSTLVRHLLAGLDAEAVSKPFAHTLYRVDGQIRIAQLGADHDTYPGTDRLSMGVLPKAVEFVAESTIPIIIAEGDRLATTKFLDSAAKTREVTLVLCHADRALLEQRRAIRGSNQNDTWLRGRQTKVHNLWTRWTGEKLRIRMSAPPDLLALQVRGLLDIDE